jgi:hypothetical protein
MIVSSRATPAGARELAGRLSALFRSDVQIAERLNDAQRRLREANERLWSGLSPDAFGLVDDGAAAGGESSIGELVGGALSSGGGLDARAVVLGALAQAHWTIHRAFVDYQSACEERRQLAVEVGELSAQLTAVLCAAGWSEHDARDADVHELAGAGVG